MEKPAFDKFAEQYDCVLRDSIPGVPLDDIYLAEYKVALAAKQLGADMPASILDFGCGCGRSLPHLAHYFPGAEIFGYDLSLASLDVTARYAHFARLSSDWEETSARKFDLIFAANVFHHIAPSDQMRVLESCRSALSQNGSFVIFEQNPLNPVTRYIFDRCPFDAGATMISMRSLKKLSAGAGLRVLQSGYTLFFPRAFAFLRPVEPAVRWMPLGAQYFLRMKA